MCEYEKIFTTNLRDMLKAKIRGGIYCAVENDILNIRITNDDFRFGININDFSNKLINGLLDKDKIINEVCCKYRNCIMKKYFVM